MVRHAARACWVYGVHAESSMGIVSSEIGSSVAVAGLESLRFVERVVGFA